MLFLQALSSLRISQSLHTCLVWRKCWCPRWKRRVFISLYAYYNVHIKCRIRNLFSLL